MERPEELHQQDMLNQMLFPMGLKAGITLVERGIYQIYLDSWNDYALIGIENEWEFKVLDLEEWDELIFDAESDMGKMFELIHDAIDSMKHGERWQ